MKSYKMKEHIIRFTDRDGIDRIVKCLYHGSHDFKLRGEASNRDDAGVAIKLPLSMDGVESHNYNHELDSFDIWYDPEFFSLRDTMTIFYVPGQVKKVNIYDKGQK